MVTWSFLPFAIKIGRAQKRANVVSYMMFNLVHSPNRERNTGNMIDPHGRPLLELQQWNVVRHVMT